MGERDTKLKRKLKLVRKLVGQAIVNWRGQQDNMSQDQLALKAHVGVATVRRVERGKSVAFDTVLRIVIAAGLLSTIIALIDSILKDSDAVESLYLMERLANKKLG